MTREEMLDFLIHGFGSETSRLTNDEIIDLQKQWLAHAPIEWIPIVIDIAIHAPDLRRWERDPPSACWDVEEEFLIGVEHLLKKWYSYAPEAWLREMTPLLNNLVPFSPNIRYATARELALSSLGGVNENEVTLLLQWIAPLSEDWNDLTTRERDLLIDKLDGYYYWHPRSHANQILLKLQTIADEPYRQWIMDILHRGEEREESTKKKMKKHQDFAHDWIAAWNAHDIDRIMSHYADDVEYQSPFVQRYNGEGDMFGILVDSISVRSYVQLALEAFPDLHFVLLNVFSGVASAVLHYQSVNNMVAAEYFQFNAAGKIARVTAHYLGEFP
jgi:hypothetical protein